MYRGRRFDLNWRLNQAALWRRIAKQMLCDTPKRLNRAIPCQARAYPSFQNSASVEPARFKAATTFRSFTVGSRVTPVLVT